MKYIVRCGVLFASLFVTACSHYVGNPDDPTVVTGSTDSLRKAFLAIRAEFEAIDERWVVTMLAQEGRGNRELTGIPGADLYVNGVRRDLAFGFPYRGSPEKLFLTNDGPIISLEYRSPEQIWFRTDYVLEDPEPYSQTFRASRTSGLDITVLPAIRENETVEVRVFKSLPASVRLVTTRTFTVVGSTTMSISAADFASQIDTDAEMVVELKRQLVSYRRIVFSDGVELTQIPLSIAQFIPVTP